MSFTEEIAVERAEARDWFESLMCEMSARFINQPANQIDAALERAQRLLCEGFGLDRSTLWQKSPGVPNEMMLTHVYRPREFSAAREMPSAGSSKWSTSCADTPPICKRLDGQALLPWIFEQIQSGRTAVIERLDDLPPEAAQDQATLRHYQTKSMVVVPLCTGEEWLGALSFSSSLTEQSWSSGMVRRIELIGHLFTHALVRKASDTAMQRNEAMESEMRFRVIADSAPVVIWMTNAANKLSFVNRRWVDFTGGTIEEAMKGWTGIHPEDLPEFVEGVEKGFERRQPFVVQGRWRRRDGVYRWMTNSGVPRIDAKGVFCGFIGSCVDMTERIEAERAAQDLSGRLIHAQEEERARLARELHDDVTQRLARLAIDVGRVERSPCLDTAAGDLIQGVREGLARLSEDVHALSYQLHPSAVIDLGLVDALKGECDEFSRRESVATRISLRQLPQAIPSDMAIGLFRIAQESLRNASRHGRATKVEVSLWGVDGGVQLVIQDDGVGFDTTLHRNRRGLGLASMRERSRLLGGTWSVDSRPGGGTMVVIWVPLTEGIL